MSELLYLTGRPASGKSTVAAALTEGLRSFVDYKPFAHTIYHQARVVALGVDRGGGFPGTDTLSMSVSSKVVGWLARPGAPALVFGEGDRLANTSFFTAVAGLGFTVVHAHLDCDDELAAARLATRTEWSPSASWLAGRVTKSRRLAERADVVLDASLPPAELVGVLVGVSGVAAALRAAGGV